jgi:Flp pilus assembly protein TadG
MFNSGRRAHVGGQTMMEAVILLPLFLPLAFAIFQVGHLAIGVAIVNYAASSVAREAVEQNAYSQSQADMKFHRLLFAGLTSSEIKGNQASDSDRVTANLTVTACAKLPAYPLVGPFLDKAIHAGSTPTENACTGVNKWIGPIGLQGPPYQFIVQGQAVARMNFNSGNP